MLNTPTYIQKSCILYTIITIITYSADKFDEFFIRPYNIICMVKLYREPQ